MTASNTDTISIEDRFIGCLLGLAVGDAVGAAVEFKPRGSFTWQPFDGVAPIPSKVCQVKLPLAVVL